MKKVEQSLVACLESWAQNPVNFPEIIMDESALLLDENLRHLPGRRLTCRARWNNQTVIAKFFYGERFSKHANMEVSILQAMEQKDILSARLLYSDKKGDCAVLIIGFIKDSISLRVWLDNQPSIQSFEEVIKATTVLIKACHLAGFHIQDPHLDNFLLSKENVYIVDAGDINVSDSALPKNKSDNNMALFYSHLPVRWDALAYQTLKLVSSNNSEKDFIKRAKWQALLIKQRQWKEKQFIQKKVFRECSRFICNQNMWRFFIMNRADYSADLELALSKPDNLIASGEYLKKGRTATVSRIEVANKTFVLKRYNIKKPIHALIRGLKWSRAAVSWKNAHILRMLGIPTAKPIALIEERWWVLRRRSYILTEHVPARHAWDVFEDGATTEEQKEYWASQIFELFVQLRNAQISHGDLKALNILCAKDGPVFIDLDGLTLHHSKHRFERQFKKDVVRFLISWGPDWETKPYFKRFKELLG